MHYVYVSDASPHLTFRQYLSVLASHKFFRPERILLHSNVAPSGKYWDLAVKTTGIEYNHVERVRRIGGKAPGWVQHEADYIKISQVLLYGPLTEFSVLIFSFVSNTECVENQSQMRGHDKLKQSIVTFYHNILWQQLLQNFE